MCYLRTVPYRSYLCYLDALSFIVLTTTVEVDVGIQIEVEVEGQSKRGKVIAPLRPHHGS